ncbi:hypothetical protein T484DRAFT_1816252 [Baffinella frigidus]|nr:hypothetical protein T484DRAFT_1816252 [Cryptophyta sp. CCMP2293]
MADGAPAADEVLVLVRGEQVKGKFITPCECFVLPSWLLKIATVVLWPGTRAPLPDGMDFEPWLTREYCRPFIEKEAGDDVLEAENLWQFSEALVKARWYAGWADLVPSRGRAFKQAVHNVLVFSGVGAESAGGAQAVATCLGALAHDYDCDPIRHKGRDFELHFPLLGMLGIKGLSGPPQVEENCLRDQVANLEALHGDEDEEEEAKREQTREQKGWWEPDEAEEESHRSRATDWLAQAGSLTPLK